MAGRRTSAPPRLAALALALLCCAGLATAQKRQRPQKPIRGLADLVCDGKLRSLEMAQAPFPTGPPWTPLNPATDFTCTRTLLGTSFSCGSQASDVCDTITFAPVLQSSGNTPGIIPPNNPLRFTIKDTSTAYLTFIQFRGGDIGTGGARLRALYGPGSTLPEDTFNYQWTVNGPQNISGQPGAQPVFGPCTDCRNDFGIKVMSLTALPGAGFRSIEISQLYGDTRCGGSGVNNDGMLWTGMNYVCVVPTCGDTDLNTEGQQAFDGCTGDQVYNAANAAKFPPNVENCCITPKNATCKNLAPPDGPPFPCPDGYQYNPAGDNKFPNVANCCLQQSCGDVEPATKPGTKFDCGDGYEYNPAASDAFPPSTTKCCLKRTCGNYQPASKPNTPFPCTGNTFYNPAAADFTPPSQSTCCLAPTCAVPNPAEPNKPFKCKNGTEFNPAQAGTTPPSQQACCTPGTCARPFPFTNPTKTWTCPANTEYNPANDDVSPPSDSVCCLPETCSNIAPVTKPGTPFTCPSGYSPKPGSANVSPPTRDNCCQRDGPSATCGNTIPGSVPPVPFNCEAVNVNLTLNLDNINDGPPSVILCCKDKTQSIADVFVIKTVDDAIDINGKVSRVQPVGYIFTFTLKVGVNANPGVFATDVVLSDVLPKGLTLLQLVEGTRRQTTLKACSFTPRQFTCTWPQLAWNEQRLVTIKARADTAGNQTNCATVTTTSDDTNPANNRDCATSRVSGACCTVNKDRCENLLPEQCTGSNILDPDNSCETSTKCRQTPTDKGACCNLRTGECIDNVESKECSGSQFTNFRPNGTCGKDNFCTGSCCLSTSTGECKDNVPKKECVAPGTWVLYGQCDIDCPKKCIPPWNSCNPSVDDPCCDGYSCQPTYKHCVVGSYACKPKDKPCYSKGLCGGHFGACCEGYTCSWSHFKGIGKCVSSNTGCQWGGGWCHKDWDCCPGAMCKHGKCYELSYNSCKKKCFSYQCYAQRKKECDAFFAAAASM